MVRATVGRENAAAAAVATLVCALACSRTELGIARAHATGGASGAAGAFGTGGTTGAGGWGDIASSGSIPGNMTPQPCVTSMICPAGERCEDGFCAPDTACPPAFEPRLITPATTPPELQPGALQWTRIHGREYLTLVGHILDKAPAFVDIATGAITKTTVLGAQCETDLEPCYEYDSGFPVTLHRGYELAGDTWTPTESRTIDLPVHSALLDFANFPRSIHATGWSAAGDGYHELHDVDVENGARSRLLVRSKEAFTPEFDGDGNPRRLFMNDYASGGSHHAVAEPAVTPDWQALFHGGTNLTGLIPLPDGSYALIQDLDAEEIPPGRAYPTWAIWKLRPGNAERLGYVSLPSGPPLRDLGRLYSRFHYGKTTLAEGQFIQGTSCDMTDTAGVTTCRLNRIALDPPEILELASVGVRGTFAFVTGWRQLSCGAEEVIVGAGGGLAYVARLVP